MANNQWGPYPQQGPQQPAGRPGAFGPPAPPRNDLPQGLGWGAGPTNWGPPQGPPYQGPPPQGPPYQGPPPQGPPYQGQQYAGMPPQQQYGGPGGGGPYGYRGRPPKKSRTGLIAGIAVGAGLLVLALIAIPLLRSQNGTAVSDPTSGPTPTEVTPPQPTRPTETAPPTVTTAPPPIPTEPTTQPPAPTRTTTQPKPQPTRRAPTDTQMVQQNKLYVTGLFPASKCAEPRARPTSGRNVYGYYLLFKRCLDKVWYPTVKEAGHGFRSPSLVVYTSPSFSSPCGSAQDAFYCGSNQTIYMSAYEDMKNWGDYPDVDRTWTRTDMAFTIAHEYGHHVQQLTGILQASWDRGYAMGSRDLELEESRRRELQASCFSAVYLGADKRYFPVSGNWGRWWRWKVYNQGDQWNPVRDHGDRMNHGWWSMRGFNSKNPGLCNTFTASRQMVS